MRFLEGFESDTNFSWRVLAIESLVIMLSILLGFTLNGWRQSASEQEAIDAALQSIAAEVRQNKQELEEHLPYYRTMRDTLEYLASVRGEETAIETGEIPGFRGYNIPLLRASAFQAARSTGTLSDMEFELANTLSSIYYFQSFYTDLIDKLTTGLVMDNFKNVGQWQMVFALMANNGDFPADLYSEMQNTLSEEYEIEESASADAAR